MTIDQRKKIFVEKLRPHLDKYGKQMLNDFFFYWTEHNEGGRKMRFEMQKVFNIERRLLTWYKNSLKYVRPNNQQSDGLTRLREAVANHLSQHPGTGGHESQPSDLQTE